MIGVVAASKHGSTSEIADTVADELRQAGLEVDRRAAEEVTSLDGFDAVVLGSPVYGGRWLEAARRLLSEQSEALAARPVWLFSVGPVGDPPKPDAPERGELRDAAAAIGAREHRVFTGRLDHSLLSRTERLMVRAVRAPDGDFRDWEEIRTWTRSIADTLDVEGGPPPSGG